MADTTIEWTGKTWNLVNGCTRKSEGCEYCYITRQTPMRIRGAKWDRPGIGGTTGRVFYPERVTQPVRWLKPSLIFPNSMGDTFDLPDDLLVQMWAAMALAQHHTFQVLTKNHGAMRSALNAPDFHRDVAFTATHMMGTGLMRTRQHALNMGDAWTTEPHPDGGNLWVPPWPLPNVWLGVSTENQRWADVRIPALRDTPAAVRWISAEPLLGPVDVDPWLHDPDCLWMTKSVCTCQPGGRRINWVVAGGETGGPPARATRVEWVRSLRDQVRNSEGSFFFKQWGDWVHDLDQLHPDVWVAIDARINLGQERHPLPMRVGKHNAGRLLDERTWDQYPDRVEGATNVQP